MERFVAVDAVLALRLRTQHWRGPQVQFRLPVILLLTLFLVSCQTAPDPWGYVEPTESDTSNAFGYILVGLPESSGLVFFYEGKVEQGHFNESFWTRATYAGIAKDGYALFKAKAGATIGLTQFKVGFDSIVSQTETKIPVFTVQPGVVTYATDVRVFRVSDDKAMLSYSRNVEAARAYMIAHHAPLAAKFEVGKFDTMTFSADTGTR